MASGRYVIRLAWGVTLATDSLRCLAAAIERHPHALILYGDEDRIDRWGRRSDPSFKGDFNHVLLLTHDALSHPVACERQLAVKLGGWREEFHAADGHDFVLRAVGLIDTKQIVHVAAVLCHRRAPFVMEADELAAGRRAVAAHLARAAITGSVEPAPEAPRHHRVRLALPARPPRVSIVICTRDNADLLGHCVASLRSRTTYPSYEINVVDNGSVEKKTVALLASLARLPGIDVVRDESPFNFSRLNNAAVSRARGEVVCLLNDDTEILSPDWLQEMIGFALLEDVGAVGARLWYPDGTLQHGGVILDADAVATHAFARYPRGDAGYRHRAVIQQELSAVTAACLVVRRSTFLAIGGFDEQLAVAFNDVDLCLRLRAAGFRTVWTPYAELIHHESISRGRDEQPSQRERYHREMALMRARWGDVLAHDPCYGPHFSRRHADYSIALGSRA